MELINRKIGNRSFIALALIVGIALGLTACGAGDSLVEVNTSADGLALRGFDAVAYLTAEAAVKGDPRYEFAWNGAKWYFSSEENMNKFKADPVAYAPQYGGYCSFAVSKGYTADGDPEAWKVVDGKLYLNYNQDVKKMWEAEQEQRIRDADMNWAGFKTKKPEHKG
jgi:YHS domain-containing protein